MKLIFQLNGSNGFQGMALLLSDQYANVSSNNSNFLPIHWLKEGYLSTATIGEYIGADACTKLSSYADGTVSEKILSSVLGKLLPHSYLPVSLS